MTPPGSQPPAGERDSHGGDVVLNTFAGAPPYDTRFDLKELLLLPEAALPGFGELLKISLLERVPPEIDRALKKLSADHALPATRLTRALRVCRLLFREAARRGVTLEGFASDLHALVPEETERLARLLLPRYRDALDALRREIVYGALTDHGHLLTGLAWRVDEMKCSQRGQELGARVTNVTLTYTEGKREKRLTVQALPDMLRALRAMCDAALE